MRTVLKAAEVYHFWANQIQLHGRCGNTSFSGAIAYSHNATIGVIATNKKGEKAYLVSCWNYSVTTAGHISAVRRSIPAGFPVFIIPLDRHASETRGWSAVGGAVKYIKESADNLAKSKRARTNRAWLHRDALNAADKAAEIMTFFGVKTAELMKHKEIENYKFTPEKGAALIDAIKRLVEGMAGVPFTDSPETLDRVKAQVERAAKRKAIADKRRSKEEEVARAERARVEQERQARRAIEEAERLVKAQGYIEMWKEGKTVPCYALNYIGSDYLRIGVSGDDGVSGMVQTSQGLQVPLASIIPYASTLATMSCRAIRTGEFYLLEERAIDFGGYKVHSINEDGTLAVGCHRFLHEEVIRFYNLLVEGGYLEGSSRMEPVQKKGEVKA